MKDTNKGKKDQNLDEKLKNEKKEKSVVTKIVLSIIAVLVILLVVLGVTAYNFYTSSIEPLDPASEDEIQVEIPSGSSPTNIARILEENGIIKSASVFNIYTRLNNEGEFKAGYYLMSPSMNVDEVIDSLQAGGTDFPADSVERITVPEGYTITQIADIVEARTSYSAEEFMALIENEEFQQNLLNQYPELLTGAFEAEDVRYVLEGYLFPATYEFYQEMTIEEVVQAMVAKMNEVMQQYYAQIEEQGQTVHEILTIASLVEREGLSYEDRTQIADVFYNRIEIGMPLQTDISVLYSLDTHKERVSYDDLAVDSPYNLYQNTGIGPGPFNSPSEESIKATINPVDTDYLYFLADIETQKVYFAETYQQHLEYKREYVDN
ncbi:endolytic transglycosylase MltG [Desemzia sp. RIT804]|uniref:endolytic transglycosylase MltG n=1 Tax=Desemzia sp. RIT 804 TaxID=2810209 RepID=UPI00194E0947|nr:endolytic transglycosylase MltG [Desemzia sp. RIT 804]MBM6613593.1 endolytic transglycosylase MltG [Desemzia sp. RIT 804]